MLGSVKEVTDFEVTVSLPCGMQGYLSIKHICDSYAKLLTEQLDSADTEVGVQSDGLNRLLKLIQSVRSVLNPVLTNIRLRVIH